MSADPASLLKSKNRILAPPAPLATSAAKEVGCLAKTMYIAGFGAVTGAAYGACAVAWFPDPVLVGKKRNVRLAGGRSSAAAVAQIIMKPTIWFALATASFCAVECTAKDIRQRDDHWNSVYGGAGVGVVMGLMARRFDVIVPATLFIGFAEGFFDYADRCFDESLNRKSIKHPLTVNDMDKLRKGVKGKE